MISGFEGRGLLNLGSAGTPPYDSECRTVELPAVLALAALRETRRERAGQRLDGALELLHLLA